MPPVRPFPRCETCGALLVRVPRPGESVSFSRALRAALAAELLAAEELFSRVAALAITEGRGRVRVSPRWVTRARSRAFVLGRVGRLDRVRYLRAGKASPDVDALRFACACADREPWITRRAAAYARELPAEVRREYRRDARDVPRLVTWLRAIGAERDAAAVERAAAPFWAPPPLEARLRRLRAAA